MRIAPNFPVCCAVAVLTFFTLACGVKSGGKQAPPADNLTQPEPSPSAEATVDATLLLSLVNAGSKIATDEQIQALFSSRCASCHNAQNPARLDLSHLPSATDAPEIKRRIELDPSAPGHMPIGSALITEEQTKLVDWLEAQSANGADPFAAVTVAARDVALGAEAPIIKGEALGKGRYALALGKRPAAKPVQLDIVLTDGAKAPKVMRVDIAALADDGLIYKTLTLEDGVDTPVATPSPTPGPSSPTPVEAHLDLRLRSTDTTGIADDAALSILRAACQTCHTAENRPRWDLTSVPPRERMSEIARRINLDEATLGHMPMSGSLAAPDLQILNQWLAEQQSPSDAFAGYGVEAVDGGGGTLSSSALDHGRTRIALGRHLPGTALTVGLVVTLPDGVSASQALNVTVPATGATAAEITVAPREKVAPTITDKRLVVANLTHNSTKVTFHAAQDDRPAEHLTYLAYIYKTPESGDTAFDSVEDIEAKGTRVGPDMTAQAPLAFEALALESETIYFINVIVKDRTGNKSVYRKLEVLTLPEVLCDPVASAGGVRAWRDSLASRLDAGTLNRNVAMGEIRGCFPRKVPHCAQRVLDVVQFRDVAPRGSDGTLANIPQKRPPAEINDVTPGLYWIPDDIEQIAAAKGWTTARYKSRHAGGFDEDTPNLLMVYVPGDKVDPPVEFDRWLNFPLPIDDDEPAIGLPQNPRPKFGPPPRAAYDAPNNFPRTFTMVSQDRAAPGRPAVVYFQMFSRQGAGPAFTAQGPVNVASCVRCHPNGLRAISPLGYHVRQGELRLPEADWKAVEYMNRMMVEGAGYKAAQWGEGSTPSGRKPLYRADSGPIMGPAVPVNSVSRTRAFIMGGEVGGQTLEACYNYRREIDVRDIFDRAPGMHEPTFLFRLGSASNINPDKVIQAMNCEGCHTNNQRWPLNDQTSFDQVQFKILVDQSMPMGMHQNPLDFGNTTGQVVDQLNADERFALANCLEKEFELEKSLLKEWLTQEECPM